MANRMSVNTSVIIPTYNGKHKIQTILNSLCQQTYKEFEVVVVIDGSTDGTEEYLLNLTLPFSFKFFNQINKGRASVRNKGAELAKGDLLIFFDDDMRLEPDCVKAHIEHHQGKPNSILTGAQIDDFNKATTDFQQYKCYLSRTWATKLKKEEDQPLPFSNLYLTAANFSTRKQVFNRIGGFNEQLRDCEDYDFALRAYQLSIPIYYSEKAFGWHDDFQTVASFIKRQLDYKQYNEVLYQLYPDRYSHLLQTRLNQPGKLNAIFFSFFKAPIWVKAVEDNYFRLLPKKLRYKLYTWIITTHSTYKAHI
jgi:glycosyltransferase involved in cell wall biosynthesis